MGVLQAIKISKSFFGVKALDRVSFTLNEGEILTVLGENGAGKSTLISILSGIYSLDEGGRICMGGRPVVFRSPTDSIKEGIGVVHQHFMLALNHTVLENIILSLPNPPIFIRTKKLRSLVDSLIQEHDLTFSCDSLIADLSVSEQQWVEILKLMVKDCKILILDEPTAVLTPQEVDRLFTFLTTLKNRGKSIIFISHKMKEVMELSDRVLILKKGHVVDTLIKGSFTKELIASLMLGDDKVPDWQRQSYDTGVPRLSVKEISLTGDRGYRELDRISFSINKGEILGIAGVSGNGQKALAEVLTGITPPESGFIYADGKDITDCDARKSYISGIAHIPEDRKSMGAALDMTVEDNMVMKSFKSKLFKRFFFFRNTKEIRKFTEEKIKKYGIKADAASCMKSLSGGNMQKVIIARELSSNPLILIALYPVRGLDVGSAAYIHKVLEQAAKRGMSILIISEDLDELLSISDRIAVIFRGKITGVVNPKTVTKEDIGLMMSGIEIEIPKEEAL